ncbi:MAG: hypothetical protein GY765_17105, partial [bacterium]|nr:hypothetical protein [bacterium]
IIIIYFGWFFGIGIGLSAGILYGLLEAYFMYQLELISFFIGVLGVLTATGAGGVLGWVGYLYRKGIEQAKKHHYRFRQYRLEELVEPSGIAYDSHKYPLPDNQDFSEYINFLIKQNQARKSGKRR